MWKMYCCVLFFGVSLAYCRYIIYTTEADDDTYNYYHYEDDDKTTDLDMSTTNKPDDTSLRVRGNGPEPKKWSIVYDYDRDKTTDLDMSTTNEPDDTSLRVRRNGPTPQKWSIVYENDRDKITDLDMSTTNKPDDTSLRVTRSGPGPRTWTIVYEYYGDTTTDPDSITYIEPKKAGTRRQLRDDESSKSTSSPTSTTSTTSTTLPPATSTTTLPTTTTSTLPPRTQRVFDIDELIALVANLTYDYDMNLTQKFNESLIRHSLPSCPTITTTTPTTTTTTTMTYDLSNTTVVGKCFVCGLDTEGIPRNAHCADAFAGDFIPLVPVDASAKSQIANYRKYCRYLDVNHYMEFDQDPRALYGRWTGGCSVRWSDLSGVYTQRSCRNNRHATTGLHFASKRMAKLEMALSHLENGCIVSPMASLLPLSRGISLFARFHVCVCTGSWCNGAFADRRWMPATAIPTILLLISRVYDAMY